MILEPYVNQAVSEPYHILVTMYGWDKSVTSMHYVICLFVMAQHLSNGPIFYPVVRIPQTTAQSSWILLQS